MMVEWKSLPHKKQKGDGHNKPLQIVAPACVATFSLSSSTVQEVSMLMEISASPGESVVKQWQGVREHSESTLPETNSKFAPENRPPNAPKGKDHLNQPSIFRGHVSFRESRT